MPSERRHRRRGVCSEVSHTWERSEAKLITVPKRQHDAIQKRTKDPRTRFFEVVPEIALAQPLRLLAGVGNFSRVRGGVGCP